MKSLRLLTLLTMGATFALSGCAGARRHAEPTAEPALATDLAPASQPAAESDPLPDSLLLQDATLGPGDTIAISVYRQPDLTTTTTVPSSGIIFVPLAGEIPVLNDSALLLRRKLTDRLAQYLVDPQVSVNITVHRSRKVMVLGEVERPGVFLIEEPTSALEIIARAGGFTEEAAKTRVILAREEGTQLVPHVLNIQDVYQAKDVNGNLALRRGDIVYVPKSTVADIDRFAARLTNWMNPVVRAESAILLGYDVEDRVTSSGIFVGY